MATETQTSAAFLFQTIIPKLFSIAASVLGVVFHFVARVLPNILTKLLSPSAVVSKTIYTFSPFPLVFYLLAPLFIFLACAFDILFAFPYKVTIWLADVIYPLYVFLGVACLTGLCLGGLGRLLLVWGRIWIAGDHLYAQSAAHAAGESTKKEGKQRVPIKPEPTPTTPLRKRRSTIRKVNEGRQKEKKAV